jgi:small subunit ribosomal protein S20
VPNIKSVAKDVIRSRSRRLRNNATKSRIKTAIKKTQSAIVAGDAAAVTTAMIHKNAANRRKSRLMKRAAAAAA